jgi:hypothetical protein
VHSLETNGEAPEGRLSRALLVVLADGGHEEPDSGLRDVQFTRRHRLGAAFGFDDMTRHHRLSRELAVSLVLMHVDGVGSFTFPNPGCVLREACAPA